MIIDTETINRFKGESATWRQGSNAAYQDGFAAGKNWAAGAHYVAMFTVER